MSQLGDSLATATTRIGELLDELDSRVALLRSAWDGEAQEAYTVAHQEWMRSLTAMQDVLAAYGRAVEEARIGYHDTEKKNADAWA